VEVQVVPVSLLCDVPQAKTAALFGSEPSKGGNIFRVAVLGQLDDDCANLGGGGTVWWRVLPILHNANW
jgi:hypothetical protein